MIGFTEEQKENIKKTGRSGYLNGEIFETAFFHTGVDNILKARVDSIGRYAWAKNAKIFHDHPMMSGKREEMDALYEQAYAGPRHDHDNELYAKRMKELGLEDYKFD